MDIYIFKWFTCIRLSKITYITTLTLELKEIKVARNEVKCVCSERIYIVGWSWKVLSQKYRIQSWLMKNSWVCWKLVHFRRWAFNESSSNTSLLASRELIGNLRAHLEKKGLFEDTTEYSKALLVLGLCDGEFWPPVCICLRKICGWSFELSISIEEVEEIDVLDPFW